MDKALNCREVMTILRCSRSTVRDMLQTGELTGFQRGKLIRIDRASVERLLTGGAREGGVAAQRVMLNSHADA